MELRMKRGGGVCWLAVHELRCCLGSCDGVPSDATRRGAKILHKVLTAENYGDVGSFSDTELTNRHQGADWATALHGASDNLVRDATLRRGGE
jgi:hypothetical protein